MHGLHHQSPNQPLINKWHRTVFVLMKDTLKLAKERTENRFQTHALALAFLKYADWDLQIRKIRHRIEDRVSNETYLD